VLSYDGTDYHGWQVQAGARTVQGALVETARRRFGADTRVTGASRTDAGVHALGQVVSLTTTARIGATGLRGALNADLPRDIRVLDAREAPAGFDARRAALGKRYAFLIDNAPIARPLLARYAWHIPQTLDVAAMRRALAGPERPARLRLVLRRPRPREGSGVRRAGAARVRRKERIAILLSADRYLHHMARNIVGSAVEVGRGARTADWLAAVLVSRDRRQAGPTAPAQGLTLVRVLYGAFS
jgi:tRNA pseudouridine38-40 synthase